MGGSQKHVWILGAGFSKALGGPLIGDLLAMREKAVLDSLFPTKDFPGVADEQFKARLFCKYGLDRRYWDHAEQFLDLVESAAAENGATHSHGRTLLQSMLKDTVRYPETIPQKGGASVFPGSTPMREVPGPSHNFANVHDLAAACRRALAVDCSI